jgi:iron complex outermembrane receptor protein
MSRLMLSLMLVVLGTAVARGQVAGGSIQGTVTLEATGEPIHGAIVLVRELRRSTKTDAEGRFAFPAVPVGTYTVLAQREHLTTRTQAVAVAEGVTARADFALVLSPIHEQVTVTAVPTGETTTFQAFNAVNTLDSVDLVQNVAPSLAEVVERLPGVARRTFGPGSSRPVIRGFDGDRVLILQDGVRTGDLSSQSGDHGTSVDPAGLSRIEVVKGPATLLYGSNAVGGVVNAITPQELFKTNPFTGVVGHVSTDAGTTNEQAGAVGSIQYGQGPLLLWGGLGGRRTSDYDAPDVQIPNSDTRLASGSGGLAYAGSRAFGSFGVQVEDTRYGIPFAGVFHGEEGVNVDVDGRREDYRFDVGARNLGRSFAQSVRLVGNYLRWEHRELEIEDGTELIGTQFNNDVVVIRAEADQRRAGRLTGRLGIWGQHRDYSAVGEEALAPPTTQTAFAAFAYEELEFDGFRVQFGGRLERNAYDPGVRPEGGGHDHGSAEEEEEAHVPPPVRDRDFTGFSGSVGIHADIGANGAFVANVSRSSRAPALEELYNFGPHIGNLAFEVGNPDLRTESTVGLDVSLRRRAGRFSGELNGYLYEINDFVFLSVTDEIVDGLRESEFLQQDARFLGIDAEGRLELGRGTHLNASFGWTRARLSDTDESLPRIPPVHGRLELDVPLKGVRITPEVVFAARQEDVYREETETAGYAVFNVGALWLHGSGHLTHAIAVRAFNLTNATYRLHTSFIKDLAPEIGRGVRVSYSVRFF